LCSEECLHTAERRRAFDRAWRTTVTADVAAALRIAFRDVIINMEQLPIAGSGPGRSVPRKG